MGGLRAIASRLGLDIRPSSSEKKGSKPIDGQASSAGLPHAFATLQRRAPPRRQFDPAAPHRASIHLEVKTAGPLAATGAEAAKGVLWNADSHTLVKFLADKKGRNALRETRKHYMRVEQAAREHLRPEIAKALVKKLSKDADFYCHPKDTLARIRDGNEEVIDRCKMFYGLSKTYIELTAKKLDDPQVDKSRKETALINLEKNLGACEMAVQNAFALAFDDLGGLGNICERVQERRKKVFDGLAEDFLQKRDFFWYGWRTQASDTGSGDGVAQRRREGAEVHIPPALAHLLGVDKTFGILVGVAKNDRFASKVAFHAADVAMMASQLREAMRLPKLIGTWTSEVCTEYGDLLRGKLKSKASSPGPDDVFGKRLRDDDLEPEWYEDLAQHAATTLGLEYLSALLSVDMDDGTYTLSRNTGALQRQIVDSLANEKNSIFRDELVVHEAAHTEGFLLERRGPVWAVRDREDGGGYAAEFRSLRLKDLAALNRADAASGTASTAWAGMARENRELLRQWVGEVNRPAFHEEMLEILRQPGAFREAMASGPPELRPLLAEAAGIVISKTWERAKVASQPNGDPASLDTLMMFYRETNLSKPGTRAPPASSRSFPEPVLLEQLARTGRTGAIAELLVAGRLQTKDPLALLDKFYPDKGSKEWLQLESLCRPTRPRFIDLLDGDDRLPRRRDQEID